MGGHRGAMPQSTVEMYDERWEKMWEAGFRPVYVECGRFKEAVRRYFEALDKARWPHTDGDKEFRRLRRYIRRLEALLREWSK